MASVPNSMPVVPGPYKCVNAIATVANTDYTGATGTVVTAYASPAAGNGSYIRDVDVLVPVTSAAAQLVILLSDGTTLVPIKTVPVTAVTPSATVAPFFAARVTLDVYLPAGGLLKILTTIGQATHCRFTIADY